MNLDSEDFLPTLHWISASLARVTSVESRWNALTANRVVSSLDPWNPWWLPPVWAPGFHTQPRFPGLQTPVTVWPMVRILQKLYKAKNPSTGAIGFSLKTTILEYLSLLELLSR